MFNKLVYKHNIMLTIVVVLIINIVFWGSMRYVRADEKEIYQKNFISVEIEYGDTLLLYAKQYAKCESDYDEYIEEVKSINHLKDDDINAGCYVLLPIYEKLNQNNLVVRH